MSIRQRGAGWQVQVPGFPAVTLPTREAAQTVELDLRLRRKLGHLYQEKPVTLGEELAGFEDRALTRTSYRRKGEEWLVSSLKAWAPLYGVMLPALRRSTVEDHLKARAKRAPVAAANELQVLKRALREALSRGQIVDLGIFEIPPPRSEKREGVALTLDELAAIESFCPEHVKRIVTLTGTVGWRFREALSLEDRHVDLDAATVTIPTRLNKSRRPKKIDLAEFEVKLLAEQLLARTPGSRAVFATRRGRHYSASAFRDHVWWPALEAAGYARGSNPGEWGEVVFHDLRHTAISLSARAGIPPEVIAERVGHNDGGALIRRLYRHLYDGEARSHVAKLDALVDWSAAGAEGQETDTATSETA